MKDFLEFALENAQKAGDILMSYYGNLSSNGIHYKGKRNLVTVADIESEQFLTGAIKKEYPDHKIFSEESKEQGKKDSRFQWIIDPLDGTTNFASVLPFFCVSIALAIDGKIEVGVTYAPYLKELFWAFAGHGAFFNGKKIHVSDNNELIHSVLSTGFAYIINETSYNNLDNFNRLTMDVRAIRRFGSACIDLAYVAAGRFDAHWEPWLENHDVAAGSLLVLEAGGKVTDFNGGDNYINGKNIVASNGLLHDIILEKLSRFPSIPQPK